MGADVKEMLPLRDLTNKSSGPPPKTGKSPTPFFIRHEETKHEEALLI